MENHFFTLVINLNNLWIADSTFVALYQTCKIVAKISKHIIQYRKNQKYNQKAIMQTLLPQINASRITLYSKNNAIYLQHKYYTISKCKLSENQYNYITYSLCLGKHDLTYKTTTQNLALFCNVYILCMLPHSVFGNDILTLHSDSGVKTLQYTLSNGILSIKGNHNGSDFVEMQFLDGKKKAVLRSQCSMVSIFNENQYLDTTKLFFIKCVRNNDICLRNPYTYHQCQICYDHIYGYYYETFYNCINSHCKIHRCVYCIE